MNRLSMFQELDRLLLLLPALEPLFQLWDSFQTNSDSTDGLNKIRTPHKMEALIAQLSQDEATDFDPEIFIKLESFLKVMIRHRIEYSPDEAMAVKAMVDACWVLTDPLALCRTLIELIGPRPEFTWSPLPLLRILAKIDPELRYIQLLPSKATYGHHGLYLQFKDYYIVLLTNHHTPLVYTQNILDRLYLSDKFPYLIQKIDALKQIWTQQQSLIQMGLTWGGHNQAFEGLQRIYGPFLALFTSGTSGENPMLNVPAGPPPRPRYVEDA